jgi:dynein heavy chain
VNALIIIEVHARDIIDTFVRDSILDHREFAWESQLRFYWDRKADDTLIRFHLICGSRKYHKKFTVLDHK